MGSPDQCVQCDKMVAKIVKNLLLQKYKGASPCRLARLQSSLAAAANIPQPNEAQFSKSDPKQENFRLRQNLALSYRIINELSLNEGSCNHLSVIVPARDPSRAGTEEVMLIAPGYIPGGGGIDWGMVTASSLIGLDQDANVVEGEGEPERSGAVIHLGVRRAKPEAKVIMHTHTPYATALGCLEDPSLLMIHQNSCRFKGRIAYDTGYQPATEFEEGRRLGEVLGDKDILFMCHHGTLVVADSIHVAFDEVYYLERACMAQILAMGAAGREALKEMPLKVQDATRDAAIEGNTLDKYAAKHFYARWNMYRVNNSNVFS